MQRECVGDMVKAERIVSICEGRLKILQIDLQNNEQGLAGCRRLLNQQQANIDYWESTKAVVQQQIDDLNMFMEGAKCEISS